MVNVEPENGDSSVPEVPDQSSLRDEPDDSVQILTIQPAISLDTSTSISPMQARADADFAVTVHDDTVSEGNADPARVSPSSNPSASARNTPEKLQEIKTNINNTLSLSDGPGPATPKAKGGRRRTNRRKRGRVVRAAEVDERPTDKPKGLLLPSSQYETIFYRRAIRKREDNKDAPTTLTTNTNTNASGPEKKSQQGNGVEELLEVYGDISLGMKLSVVGGKVIVQHLNALVDGRASPAQLTGVVQRGDVLISINNTNLVNLPIDQLMSGLSPLSTPDATGAYQRTLKLRFAGGEGLDLLAKSEAVQAKKADTSGSKAEAQQRADAVNDMFALFPMVDQLSGMPLFDDPKEAEPIAERKVTSPKKDDQGSAQLPSQAEMELGKKDVPLDDTISCRLATERMTDRELFASEFYGWNDHYSGLLRQSIHVDVQSKQLHMSTQSLAELIELGRRAILGAKALSKCLEDVDRGLDVRSFRSWNSTISLYSRASTRRKYVLDSASLPVNFGKVAEEEEDESGDEGSQATGDSNDEDPVDGDELLLRLASHDEIWRKQVIEFLEGAIHEANDENEEQPQEASTPETGGIDSALSKQLGSFLFGENMSKILTKNKRPQALPSEEITAVLFDLATKVSSTVPDKITAAGSLVSYRSSLVPFTGIKRPASESDAMLATQFLLHEALPVWTKTFRPLPWEHRRVLWPLEKSSSGESTAASTMSDDNLTLDSWGTNANSPGRHRKRKNLREMIEDQELDAETRSETCFLVTYLFTQKMLPKLLYEKDDPTAFEIALNEISSFVRSYGSYLKMHTCLAYAALLKAEEVIDLLLEAAKYDPRHREMMKLTSKANALVFYEPTMLSTVIQRLHLIRTASASERRVPTIYLCAAAFPDVRPWQVKKECSPEGRTATEPLPEDLKVELEDLYYTYLSILLHSLDGHEAARSDSSLVQEWCELSTCAAGEDSTVDKTRERRKHFFCVASRTSSDHLAYHRDLVMILKLSMKIGEHELALDIAGEIVDDPSLSNDKDAVGLVLESLREIGACALDTEGKDQQTQSARFLKRMIRLYRKTSTKKSLATGQMTNVPAELLLLLEHKRKHSRADSNPNDLIEFLADEASPSDILQTLSTWTASSDTTMEAIPVLHTILRRGAHASISSELSGSLLSLKRARLRIREESTIELGLSEDPDVDEVPEQSIWKKMSKGVVVVAK